MRGSKIMRAFCENILSWEKAIKAHGNECI